MCIAIFKPANQTVSKTYLHNSFARNQDGAGYAFSRDKKLVVRKGFMTFDEFWDSYQEVQESDSALIHFRIKTHGKVDAENCHPWVVGDTKSPELCFIHNGTLSDFTPEKNSSLSDTGTFRDLYLNEVFRDHGKLFPTSEWINYSLLKIIGSSKLAFLDNDGNATIVNENAGLWQEGCWFSNESFRTAPINQGVCDSFQAYRHKGTNQIFRGEGLQRFLSVQQIKGQNKKKLKKLLKSGVLELVQVNCIE